MPPARNPQDIVPRAKSPWASNNTTVLRLTQAYAVLLLYLAKYNVRNFTAPQHENGQMQEYNCGLVIRQI